MSDNIRMAIIRAAQEAGIDPRYALAVADRESSFNPSAKNSKSIYGLFQMTGENRARYGAGDSDDPYTQARAFAAMHGDVRKGMSTILGRDPTDEESYLGHHFGPRRAARMMTGDPERRVEEIFTPREMAANPHFGRAGTAGALMSSVMGDITRRKGSGPMTSDYGDVVEGVSMAPKQTVSTSSFGDAIGGAPAPSQPTISTSSFGDVV